MKPRIPACGLVIACMAISSLTAQNIKTPPAAAYQPRQQVQTPFRFQVVPGPLQDGRPSVSPFNPVRPSFPGQGNPGQPGLAPYNPFQPVFPGQSSAGQGGGLTTGHPGFLPNPGIQSGNSDANLLMPSTMQGLHNTLSNMPQSTRPDGAGWSAPSSNGSVLVIPNNYADYLGQHVERPGAGNPGNVYPGARGGTWQQPGSFDSFDPNGAQPPRDNTESWSATPENLYNHPGMGAKPPKPAPDLIPICTFSFINNGTAAQCTIGAKNIGTGYTGGKCRVHLYIDHAGEDGEDDDDSFYKIGRLPPLKRHPGFPGPDAYQTSRLGPNESVVFKGAMVITYCEAGSRLLVVADVFDTEKEPVENNKIKYLFVKRDDGTWQLTGSQ